MTKTEKHVHKLKKINYKSGNSVFFCVLDCGFKISVALALGKKSICWRCGIDFIMNEYSLRLTKPHCSSCHKSKKDKEEIIIPKSIGLLDRLNSITKKEEEEEL